MHRVATQRGTVLIKSIQPSLREKSLFCQHRIERGTRVPFTKDESVALKPRGPQRINAKNPPIKNGQQVNHRKTRADMRTLRAMNHSRCRYSNRASKTGQIARAGCSLWHARRHCQVSIRLHRCSRRGIRPSRYRTRSAYRRGMNGFARISVPTGFSPDESSPSTPDAHRHCPSKSRLRYETSAKPSPLFPDKRTTVAFPPPNRDPPPEEFPAEVRQCSFRPSTHL